MRQQARNHRANNNVAQLRQLNAPLPEVCQEQADRSLHSVHQLLAKTTLSDHIGLACMVSLADTSRSF